jgi:hypothetical protein
MKILSILASRVIQPFTTLRATTAYLLGTGADTSSIRLGLESGSLAVREGDDSGYAPLIASAVTIGDEALTDRGSSELGVGGLFSAGSSSGIRVTHGSIGSGYPGGLYRGTGGTAWARVGAPSASVWRISNGDDTNTFDTTTADWGTTLSAEAVALANDASVLIGAAISGTVHISYPADAAIFMARGTANAVRLADGAATFTVTKDNASTVNFYYDTNGYYLQNKTGGALSFRVVVVGG